MPFISITRLRIRSVRFLPAFAFHTLRSQRQVRRARGYIEGALLADSRWTFWTLTRWDSRDDMRAYMTNGAHRAAMPHLMHWCDEASVANWDQQDDALPSWPEAVARMRREGRPSKVRHPSPDHAGMTFSDPRTTGSAPLRARP